MLASYVLAEYQGNAWSQVLHEHSKLKAAMRTAGTPTPKQATGVSGGQSAIDSASAWFAGGMKQ